MEPGGSEWGAGVEKESVALGFQGVQAFLGSSRNYKLAIMDVLHRDKLIDMLHKIFVLSI